MCYTASHVLIHLGKERSYPLIELYRPYGVLHVFIGCLYEWSRKSCQFSVCYTASHVFIYLEDEWSYQLIKCYRPYGILHYLLDDCMNDLVSLVNPWCVILPHMSLYTLKTNDLTHWSNFIDHMAYYTYLLDACMNDLVSLVNPWCVKLPHMSLYTLKTNDRTHWSNFIDRYGILHVYIGCLYEWSRKSCQSLVCYTASHVLIHLEKEWSYPPIEFYWPYGTL